MPDGQKKAGATLSGLHHVVKYGRVYLKFIIFQQHSIFGINLNPVDNHTTSP